MQHISLAVLGAYAQSLTVAIALAACLLGPQAHARPPAQNSLQSLGVQSNVAKIEMLRAVHGIDHVGRPLDVDDRIIASLLTMFGGGAGAGLDAVRRAEPADDSPN